MGEFGFLVDLHKVKLDESNGATTSWVQGMTVGTYQHPVYGEITFDEPRITRFSDNVNNNVRGTDLDIDYDHKDKSGRAAGWVKQAADKGSEGLYLLVEWTDEAAKAIKAKEYRYFSPEFSEEWTHPKTGQKFKDVLFGGALTNRPFLKDIQPINLSETFAELQNSHENTETQEEGMTDEQRKRLAKSYGLPEDATEEQIMAAADSQSQQREADAAAAATGGGGGDNGQGGNQPEGGAGTSGGQPEGGSQSQPVAANEALQEILKLTENNPAVKWLYDKLTEQDKELRRTSVALRMSEVDSSVKKLSEKLPPAITDELKKFMLNADEDSAKAVYKMFETVAETGTVELGEHGQQPGGQNINKDATTRFEEAVHKVMSDREMGYADAVSVVSNEQPKLFEEAWSENYSWKGTD